MMAASEPTRPRRRARPSLHPELRALTVSFDGQKGGAGKTTAATELAFYAVQTGHKVLLVDRDRQHTATIWQRIGQAAGHPVPNTADLATLRRDLAGAVAGKGYHYIFIDCPPGDAEEQREALAMSDLAVIPCGATPEDMWAVYGHPLDPDGPTTVKAVREAQAINPRLDARILLSKLDRRTALGRDARAHLQVPGGLPLFKAELSLSAWYGSARLSGVGVVAFAPQSRAAKEVKAVFAEIEACRRALLSEARP